MTFVPGRAASCLSLLALLLTAGPVAAAAPSPSPADIRVKTTTVFDRPEFRSDRSGGGGWVLRQLAAFFGWLGGLYDNARPLFWLILVACLAALAAMVALIVFQIRSVFVRGGGRDGRPGGEAHERARRSAAYREEAARRAAAGDYTEAVRFLFLSLVYRFDERGRVSFHKEYTNREYLDLLGDRVPVRAALEVMVDTLDDHWYGQRPCGLAHYEACLAVYDRLAATV